MRFEILSLADAANNAPDGKLNVLGLGIRIVNVPGLPAGMPLAVLGSVSAGPAEAGDYDLDVRMVEPDGTEVPLAQGRSTVPAEVVEPRVPTGVGFVVGFGGPFRIEGLHVIRARFGKLVMDYEFVVRLQRAPGSSAEAAAGEAAG
ncbi:MAG: DUF6941 family protein [Candidatus Dormibacterales bacterium]